MENIWFTTLIVSSIQQSDLVIHTSIYKADNQQEPTVQQGELCSIFHNNLEKESEK